MAKIHHSCSDCVVLGGFFECICNINNLIIVVNDCLKNCTHQLCCSIFSFWYQSYMAVSVIVFTSQTCQLFERTWWRLC